MVGTVKVVLGRGVVVAVVVGGVITGSVAGGTVAGGTVVAGWRAVVGGASSSGAVVLVEADDDPPEEDPDDHEDGLPEERTEATGAGVFPDRSGILSGGVASAGLATVMKRLKICAGSEPPLTRLSPWMLYSGLDWPSG